MNHATENLFSLTTYFMAITGIIVNFDTIKGLVLFIGALVLLVLQIYLHILKIRKEKNNKDNEKD